MTLEERLRDRIRSKGSISFADWMEACLYDPEEGYYMRPGRKTGTGDDADFVTNPTLHPFFAHAVANEVVEAWVETGRPGTWTVWEFGGGEGDLARDALSHLDDVEPDLARVLTWHHIERSPVHRAAQKDSDARIRPVEEIPSGAMGVVVAHEFLDALPFHVLERRKGGWAQVCVTLHEDRLTESLGMPCREAIEAAPAVVDEGWRVVAMHEARAWIHYVGSRLVRGRVLIVDYGAEGMRLWRRDPKHGTVRTFRAHGHGNDPLEDPGLQDITASVDFALVADWAEAEGLAALPLESQEAFLLRHGVLEALNSIPRDTPDGASQYLRLRQMLLPNGMGEAFRVLRLDAGKRSA